MILYDGKDREKPRLQKSKNLRGSNIFGDNNVWRFNILNGTIIQRHDNKSNHFSTLLTCNFTSFFPLLRRITNIRIKHTNTKPTSIDNLKLAPLISKLS
jgi:hypothetical protein